MTEKKLDKLIDTLENALETIKKQEQVIEAFKNRPPFYIPYVVPQSPTFPPYEWKCVCGNPLPHTYCITC